MGSNRAWAAAAMAASVAWVGGCATAPVPPTQLPEVKPGYVAGYLQPEQLPDGLALVPRPPLPGSAALAADEEAYRETRKFRDTARWALAASDADLLFPHATGVFSCVLDMPISAEATPHLNMLLRRVRMDSSRANDKPKDYYKRKRPFAVTGEASCTPKEEATMKPDAYPSGHASIGWAWSLVLAEAVPDRADVIFQRGFAFGQSRVICGAHWQSDVEAGRVIGAATVSRLRNDPVFLAQMAEARKEIEGARAAGRKSPRDCAAEAKALASGR